MVKEEKLRVLCRPSLAGFFKDKNTPVEILTKSDTIDDIDLAIRVSVYQNGNLKKVMENSLEFVEAEAERKGLEVKVEIDMDDVESVTGDPLRLQQILINILSNAVKYTEKGAITARAWKEEISITLSRLSISWRRRT